MKQYQKYISEGSTESYTKLIDTQQYIKENMKHRKLPMAFTSKLITLFVAQYSFVIYSMYKKVGNLSYLIYHHFSSSLQHLHINITKV